MTRNEKDALVLEVLRSGGYFRYQLERVFIGRERNREQFKVRLCRADHSIVKGIGYAAREACFAAKLLVRRDCFPGSVWRQEHVLRETAA